MALRRSAWLPEIARPILTHAYTDAFRSLLYILTAITVISALAVLGFLSRTD
jgi:hypothetical protein